MKEKQSISIEYIIHTSSDELNSEDKEILREAVLAAKGAYAPYSEFKVGAAVRLKSGKVVIGSNQENAAYPSGLCAERVAIFSASANFKDEEMETIAIHSASESTAQKQISPCGSCRQVMTEYEVKQQNKIRVLLMNYSGEVWEFSSCLDLLPLAFDSSSLKKKEGN